MEIVLRIHSFIDIITNSSTEIFVQANDETIKNIKNLVNSILTIGGSSLKCDDIFEMSIVEEIYSPGVYYETQEELQQAIEEGDEYVWTNCLIKTKTLVSSKEAELAANIINNLYNLFEGEERCTG